MPFPITSTLFFNPLDFRMTYRYDFPMNLLIWIPIVLGAAAVLQGGLNRVMAKTMGLSTAVWLNSAVFFIVTTCFFFAVKLFPQVWPRGFSYQTPTLEWWHILPGIFGFSLVLGLPYAIADMGAMKTFVILVASQVLFSVLWDLRVEALSLSPLKMAGAVLVFLGLLLTSIGR